MTSVHWSIHSFENFNKLLDSVLAQFINYFNMIDFQGEDSVTTVLIMKMAFY